MSLTNVKEGDMKKQEELAVSTYSSVKESKSSGIVGKVGGKVSKQIRKKHACERAFMCALAVCLLWMTSLAVAKELVEFFIPTPKLDKVIDMGNNLMNTAQAQRGLYEKTASDTADFCERKFKSEKEVETTSLFDLQTRIWAGLNATRDNLQECQTDYYDAIRVLDFLQQNHSVNLESASYFHQNKPLCTPGSLATVLSTQVVSAQAIQDVEDYKARTDDNVNSLSEQLKRRIEYDVNYLDSKTGGFLTNMKNNIDGNLTDPDALMGAAEKEFNKAMACFVESGEYGKNGKYTTTAETCSDSSVFQKMGEEYKNMMNQYKDLRSDVEAYKKEALDKYNRFATLYAQLKAVYDTLTDALLVQLSGWSLGSIGDIVTLGSLNAVLNLNLEDLLDTPAEIQARLIADAQKQLDALLAEGSAIDNANKAIQARTEQIKALGFGDYDPPPVDSGDEYEKESAQIVAKVTSQLGAVQSNPEDQPSLSEIVDESQVNVNETKAKLLEKADPRTWSFFQYEDTVFERFSQGMQSVSDYALAFDYAFRILKSLFLIRKYWMLSAVSTPPADVRTKAGIDAGLFRQQQTPMQKIAAILTHPAVNLLMIIVFLSIFSITFYLAYEPLYNEYTEGCVKRCWTDIQNNVINETTGSRLYPGDGEGTMLYRNAYVVAEEYAFTDGDYVVSTRIDALNVERDLACRDNVVDSLNVKLRQDDTFDFYQERHVTARDNIEYLTTCLNLTTINKTYAGVLQSFDFAISDLMADGARKCKVNLKHPDMYVQPDESRIFRCSKLTSCVLASNGPNEPLLRGVTHDSTCTAEWYFHATTLGTIMITVVFCLTNLSRYIFLRSITKIWWRHLVSNRFSFLASCTESGRVIYPEDVTEKGESFRKVITKQLRVALRSFEREGYIELFFAIAFNVPWIAVLIVLSRNLEFDESKICADN